MRERPILFSGPMVRAIIEGRKTVTRRAIKHQPDVPVTDAIPRRDYPHGPATVDWYWRPQHGHLNGVPSSGWDFKCPYGQPGDRLWVRETFAVYGDEKFAAIHYRADRPHDVGRKGVGYKPSIHMPRWACRILLEIADVRVERLQDISEEQARAEGVLPGEHCVGPLGTNTEAVRCRHCGKLRREHIGVALVCRGRSGDCWNGNTAKGGFGMLWESINGAGSWDANPWVWVVEFKRVEVANG
ncbi:hypothetical protein Q1Z72_03810 [Pseudomonas qingdaonensis]|uniref:hypothetical protein n=1 Tax=Pseudomonas TaxID=286 RepID=UPI00265E6344|nr:hypothetical protein [Pseudomonas qingdaonensis]WKL67808.1 hypothetical protein Q1Z72_03810 [Pseudomonas qingdaonensis]